MSNKHKRYDMIVAKAANMDLVVLCKFKGSEWVESRVDWHDSFNFLWEYECFLCLPQHNESGQCLHWLNGGAVQDDFEGEWSNCPLLSETINTDSENSLKFSYHHMFMNEEFNFRIAPKKEKRWVAYMTKDKKLGSMTFGSESMAREVFPEADQFIEIEVNQERAAMNIVEIKEGVTADSPDSDGEICVNIEAHHPYDEDSYLYLTKAQVERLLSMFD